MTNHEIDNLMQKYSKGDIKALEALYRGMSEPVYYYILRLVGDPDAAQDIMQDTFLAVINSHTFFSQKQKGSAWIFTIAKNKYIDYSRKNIKTVPIDDISNMSINDSQIDNYFSNDSFLHMLSPLNKKERDIVILRLLSGMTLTQVAKELDIPKGSVFWTYNNAIKKLRKLYKEDSGYEK